MKRREGKMIEKKANNSKKKLALKSLDNATKKLGIFERLKRLLHLIVHFYFPQSCVHCKNKILPTEKYLCFSCWAQLPTLPNYFKKSEADSLRFASYPVVKNVYIMMRFQKGNIAQSILHAIKYGGRPDIATYLFQRFAYEIKKENAQSSYDFIIPVPLYFTKYWTRSYNQSFHLGLGVLKQNLAPHLKEILIKNRDQKYQFDKTKFDRHQTVEDAFRIKKIYKNRLKGKSVLLIDDVYTTGTTLESCIHVLQIAGVKSIDCMVLGKTD